MPTFYPIPNAIALEAVAAKSRESIDGSASPHIEWGHGSLAALLGVIEGLFP
jgi:hypothetical protein